jgi:methanogenic corrinoid protein MtbC1
VLALLLRREGYRTEFLGTGVPATDLIDYVRAERPALVCLAVTIKEAVPELVDIQEKLAQVRPPIQLGVGGRAFTLQDSLRHRFGPAYLGNTIPEACANIRKIVG